MATLSIEIQKRDGGTIISGPKKLMPSSADNKPRLIRFYDELGGKSVTVLEDRGGRCFITRYPKPPRVKSK